MLRPAPSRPRRLARLLLGASLAAAAAGVAVIPSVAQAAPGVESSGPAEGMMPSSSPDAQPSSGPSVRPRINAQVAAAPLLGVDVSSHQHSATVSIDWNQVAASGQGFAMVKATELYTDSDTHQPVAYTNPYLRSDLDRASAAGLVVGAYAFARPQNSAIAQADNFAAAVGTLPAGSLPPVLDLEVTGGLSVPDLVSWTQAFLLRMEADTGITPMIYSSPSFWSDSLGGSTAFSTYPLWEAHYTSAAAPAPMGGWSTYTLWQYTSSGSVPGISGNVDQDRFNGTVDQLRGVAQQPGPPAVAARAASSPDLGGATSPLTCRLVGGGCVQHFTTGSVYWSPYTGAHVVRGAIRDKWAQLGWETGALGYPTTDEVALSGGAASVFQGGSIYWSPATGAHMVRGAIRDKWAQWGWETGALGYPTTDEVALSGGAASVFQGGSIYFSPGTGAHMVRGAIRDEWARNGWENGWLGYPTSDEYAVPGGARSDFRGGFVTWSPPGAVSHRW